MGSREMTEGKARKAADAIRAAARVTITEVDETLSTAEGRAARALAENTAYGEMTIVDISDAEFGCTAFEVRRTADRTDGNPFGFTLVHLGGKSVWETREQAEAVVRHFAPLGDAPSAEDIEAGEDEAARDEEITRAAYELGKQVDITVDGEYGDHDEVKIVMTTAQLGKLAELLKLANLHAVELVGDIDGAQFAREFIAEAEGAIDTILSERDDA